MQLIFKFIFSVCLVIPINLAWSVEVDEARHLLTRTGFGASYKEINELKSLSYSQAVDQIVNNSSETLVIPPPSWLLKPINFDKKMKNASKEQRKMLRKARKKKELELKAWWIAEMANTESPITEKMVLFWHNHFTSSLKKVKQPILLFNQNQLFRRHALGNFKQLTYEISKDPAMLGYLDNFKSSKQSPNENFARELLELFTLGEGNYSENDIKEAARAFTGWSIDRKTGKFKYRKARHDFGEKTFLGQKGKLDGDDIIEIIFQQPEVATQLVTKLWKEFISETPNSTEVDRLAQIFRDHDYEIQPLMHSLLNSKYFKDKKNYARLIKSPVDYVVGTLRMLEIPVNDGKGGAFACAHLGQNLFDPPNVKGWSGGKDWITSSSLLTRQQLLERMFRGENAEIDKKANKKNKMFSKNNPKVDLRPFLEKFSKQHSKQEITDILLAEGPVNLNLLNNKANLSVDDIIGLMSDPVYQLK